MIDDDDIWIWRINYGLDKRTPEDAGRWWHERNNGMAPAGAVAALGLCLDEIERLRALCAEKTDACAALAMLFPRNVELCGPIYDGRDYCGACPRCRLYAAGRGEGEA